jgi:hypothetical protein
MKTAVYKWGQAHGRKVLAYYTSCDGACDCGHVGRVWAGGIVDQCGPCLWATLRYWESRAGSVMEFDIFPREGGRVDRAMTAGAWDAIAAGLGVAR